MSRDAGPPRRVRPPRASEWWRACAKTLCARSPFERERERERERETRSRVWTTLDPPDFPLLESLFLNSYLQRISKSLCLGPLPLEIDSSVLTRRECGCVHTKYPRCVVQLARTRSRSKRNSDKNTRHKVSCSAYTHTEWLLCERATSHNTHTKRLFRTTCWVFAGERKRALPHGSLGRRDRRQAQRLQRSRTRQQREKCGKLHHHSEARKYSPFQRSEDSLFTAPRHTLGN